MQGAQAIRDAVSTLPIHTVTRPQGNPRLGQVRTFRGALLFDYAVAAGLIAPGTSGGDMGNCYFAVTSGDGFRVALAFAEVAARFTTKQVLLAFEQDGEPVRSGLRLVVPGDVLGGRGVAGIEGVELARAEASSTDAETDGVEVTGLVEQPKRYTAEDLRRFAPRTVRTQVTQRRGGREVPGRDYAGALLYDLVTEAGPRVDPAINEDILNRVLVATGVDGYAAVLAAGEVLPRFMAGEAVVATSDAGSALEQSDGRFRLVVPFDHSIGRSVKRLARIEVRQA